MTKRSIPANYFLLVAILIASTAIGIRAQESKAQKTESRRQAVLKITGTFLPDTGGLKLTEVPTIGPGANLELHEAKTPTRGVLDIGDTITEIEGKKFSSQRTFLDLMNEAYQQKNGRVKITVKDVNTGRSFVWIVTPEIVKMNVPTQEVDFLAELGDPVAPATDVPLVPIMILD